MTSRQAEAPQSGSADVAGSVTGLVGRVIVGVDDSAAGLAALREAVTLARAHHVPLVAVRAWALGLPRHGGRRFKHLVHRHVILYFSGAEQHVACLELTRQAFKRALGSLPADVDLVMETPAGDPGIALTSMARRPGDLLVLGSSRRPSLRGLVHGSLSGYCQRHARCPLVVVASDYSGDERP